MIICGGSAYPRFVEFEKFKEVANEVGAFLMADIAHPSGLIAAVFILHLGLIVILQHQLRIKH